LPVDIVNALNLSAEAAKRHHAMFYKVYKSCAWCLFCNDDW